MGGARAVTGLVAGASLVLSAAAHSLLGWPGLKQELAAAGVPADLARGVQIGWHFGGAAMLAFGVIAIALFARRLRGGEASTLPAKVIGWTYLAFGGWALWLSDFSPFFAVFLVPGALLVIAASGPAPVRR